MNVICPPMMLSVCPAHTLTYGDVTRTTSTAERTSQSREKGEREPADAADESGDAIGPNRHCKQACLFADVPDAAILAKIDSTKNSACSTGVPQGAHVFII